MTLTVEPVIFFLLLYALLAEPWAFFTAYALCYLWGVPLPEWPSAYAMQWVFGFYAACLVVIVVIKAVTFWIKVKA